MVVYRQEVRLPPKLNKRKEVKIMKKTFKDLLVEQYSRLSEFEVEMLSNGDVYVWHREDRTSITYHFDEQGNLVDTY